MPRPSSTSATSWNAGCGAASFDGGLIRLRTQGLLPERLLPLAVVAARIEGVEPDAIAEGLRLDGAEVRRILRARSWRAVWRFDVRDAADGTWTPDDVPLARHGRRHGPQRARRWRRS